MYVKIKNKQFVYKNTFIVIVDIEFLRHADSDEDIPQHFGKPSVRSFFFVLFCFVFEVIDHLLDIFVHD